MKCLFNKYVGMIRKISGRISKKYHLEYDDVLAQGHLIFCIAMESYDLNKSSFSTYLYIQLNGRLKDYALSEVKNNYREGGSVYFDRCVNDDTIDGELGFNEHDCFLETVESLDYALSNVDIIKKAKKNLDYESYAVFDYLLNFSWHKNGRAKPTVADVMRKFGFSRKKADLLWDNCRNFWRKNNALVA